MIKIVTFKVTVEVDDAGDFDEGLMRDGLVDSYFRGLDEGVYTKVGDETTIFGSVSIRHEGTVNG